MPNDLITAGTMYASNSNTHWGTHWATIAEADETKKMNYIQEVGVVIYV